MDFRISALDTETFAHLYGQDQESLEKRGIRRLAADCKPGFPCRVSLCDADVGDPLLLLNYEHQPSPTPYRSRHAILVREWATTAVPQKNEVPDMLRHRLLSVRAFDAAGMLIDADTVDGKRLESLIERLLRNESADYLHVHNAKLGCYMAQVRPWARVGDQRPPEVRLIP